MALNARSGRRRLQELRAQVKGLSPRQRELRGARILEEKIKLLEVTPIAVLDFGPEPIVDAPVDSGLETAVLDPPANGTVDLVEAASEPPANEAVDLVEAAFEPPDEDFVTFANNFPTYCHQCEDTTWLDLDAHKLAFHKEGKDDEEPSKPPCQRLCTCGRHRIYLASHAPKFGDKPIKSRINKVVTGQRIEPSDIPGLNFWIRTKNDCYVRPHPEDVGTFEHEFLPYDADAGVDDHISG